MLARLIRKILVLFAHWKYSVVNKGGSLLKINKHDPKFREEISKIFHRYYIQGDRGDDIIISDMSQIHLDGHPDYVPEMLSRIKPHDDDYVIFRSFQDKDEAILDIGANWGYSAGSFWTVGARSKIISFEAIPLYRDCLQKILTLRPEAYSYLMTALADKPGNLRFAVPVVNNTALTALTSASEDPHLDSLASNVHNYVLRCMPHVEDINLRICEFEVPVRTLDDVIAELPELIPEHGVAVIKLDVEGLEYEILKGGINTLRLYKPLIMTEGGNRRNGLQEFMASLGYSYAEREVDKLKFVSGMGMENNGFFVNNERINEYRARKLLLEVASC
jgi:FkbM family methyltransferase